ncbi:MAG: Alkaline phosphatase, partial [uncultured Gemmatimonadetes bacterium]
MDGGFGSDTFVVRAGSGRDTIRAYDWSSGRVDTLKFDDVPSTGITGVRTVGYDLVVEYGTGDAVTLQNFFQGADYQVNRFEFSDGVTWTQAQFLAAYPVTLTDGHDDLRFLDEGERIYAGQGNDSVYSLGGDDQVFGEAGHDTLYGGRGNDRLSGGDGGHAM